MSVDILLIWFGYIARRLPISVRRRTEGVFCLVKSFLPAFAAPTERGGEVSGWGWRVSGSGKKPVIEPYPCSSITVLERIDWLQITKLSFLAILLFDSTPAASSLPSSVSWTTSKHTGIRRKRDNLLTGEGEGVGVEPNDTITRNLDPL